MSMSSFLGSASAASAPAAPSGGGGSWDPFSGDGGSAPDISDFADFSTPAPAAAPPVPARKALPAPSAAPVPKVVSVSQPSVARAAAPQPSSEFDPFSDPTSAGSISNPPPASSSSSSIGVSSLLDDLSGLNIGSGGAADGALEFGNSADSASLDPFATSSAPVSHQKSASLGTASLVDLDNLNGPKRTEQAPAKPSLAMLATGGKA